MSWKHNWKVIKEIRQNESVFLGLHFLHFLLWLWISFPNLSLARGNTSNRANMLWTSSLPSKVSQNSFIWGERKDSNTYRIGWGFSLECNRTGCRHWCRLRFVLLLLLFSLSLFLHLMGRWYGDFSPTPLPTVLWETATIAQSLLVPGFPNVLRYTSQSFFLLFLGEPGRPSTSQRGSIFLGFLPRGSLRLIRSCIWLLSVRLGRLLRTLYGQYKILRGSSSRRELNLGLG